MPPSIIYKEIADGMNADVAQYESNEARYSINEKRLDGATDALITEKQRESENDSESDFNLSAPIIQQQERVFNL